MASSVTLLELSDCWHYGLGMISYTETKTTGKSQINMKLSLHYSKNINTYACIKGHLEPTHLKPSPLFTFATKLLG